MLLLPRSPILISCTSDARGGDDEEAEDSRSDGDDAEVVEETTTGNGRMRDGERVIEWVIVMRKKEAITCKLLQMLMTIHSQGGRNVLNFETSNYACALAHESHHKDPKLLPFYSRRT